jgi:hypothetical protein
MKLIRNALAATFIAAISVAACSTQQGTTGTGGNGGNVGTLPGYGNDGLGSVGLHLQIGNGVVLQNLSYNITGPQSFSGTVPIGDAQSIEFVVGGLPAGGPYTIVITGTDSNGDPCTGTSATFSIIAGQTSSTVVTITCTEPADASNAADVSTGNVAIDASVNLITASAYNCPGISGLSITPAEIIAPQTAALDITTVQAAGGTPGTLTINWTTTGGFFVNDAGANVATSASAAPTFNCGSFTGTAVVTATIGLTGTNNGVDAGDVCGSAPFQTISSNIVCEVGGQLICVGSTPTTCGTGSSAICTNLSSDPNNCGTCGKVCPSAEACVSGTCACTNSADPNFCGSVCTNTNTDTNNCGSCGNICPASTPNCSGGTCSAPLATVCTTAPCANNTITCTNNKTNGACTATEAAFVQIDINTKLVTGSPTGTVADGANATTCLGCLNNSQCIDIGKITGLECGDITGANSSFTSANGVVTSSAALACINSLNCITGTTGFDTTLNANCASDPAGISYCSCGAGGFATNSNNNAGTIGCSQDTLATLNGVCNTTELSGMNTDAPGTFVANYTTTSVGPSGFANQILACAINPNNNCTMCFNKF